jgi:hypothetical protein
LGWRRRHRWERGNVSLKLSDRRRERWIHGPTESIQGFNRQLRRNQAGLEIIDHRLHLPLDGFDLGLGAVDLAINPAIADTIQDSARSTEDLGLGGGRSAKVAGHKCCDENRARQGDRFHGCLDSHHTSEEPQLGLPLMGF